HVDFVNTANSTFTGPTKLTVPTYSDACPFFACVIQPSPGENLDSIGNRLMFRLAYRNLGTHETMVATHSVKGSGSGNAPAAVRWYEIRSPGTSPRSLQVGTVGSRSSALSRWMGSIAMDKQGNIALGYSKSDKNTFPSIEFVGRLDGDPHGKMRSAQGVVNGGGVQVNSFNRWGDYS